MGRVTHIHTPVTARITLVLTGAELIVGDSVPQPVWQRGGQHLGAQASEAQVWVGGRKARVTQRGDRARVISGEAAVARSLQGGKAAEGVQEQVTRGQARQEE